MRAAEPLALPSLAAFLDDVAGRLKLLTARESRLRSPLLAISEGPETFLTDAICDANRRFSAIWPKAHELGGGGGGGGGAEREVAAFVAAVTVARDADPHLQKRFDQLVPRKVKAEATFWRRYFGHAHALLASNAPSPAEMLAEAVGKLPPRAQEPLR